MNSIKVLKSLGFKKIISHKPGYDNKTHLPIMVPDTIERKMEIVDGKKTMVDVKKIHRKSNSFWILNYINYDIWVSVINHKIEKIWIQNKLHNNDHKECLKLVYNISDGVLNKSKNQILEFFPKSVKRNILLDELLS